MLKLKQLWSFFFLLVYSVSFGHAIIPSHKHLNSDGTHPPTHCETESDKDHDHIVHDNHVDEGIVDFLGCLIENLHNNLPEKHHTCHETYTLNTQIFKKVTQSQHVSIIPSVFQLVPISVEKETISTDAIQLVEEVTSPLPKLRGPPTQ
ncbi:hypothetical protein DNU06_03325 [Putridiphycobacter roseus]|uniref:Uncharacterized protein n=1 Tax=Putridiphycobacter roseus TaxID=2219161 RepID=A0A2W1N4X4_9FLAO|nr:hypothetical protein [Putridiphycobacter roseus]PZE18874.1 hypothetical protein DNU06_03325 [Putridiphycobacter roseus]